MFYVKLTNYGMVVKESQRNDGRGIIVPEDIRRNSIIHNGGGDNNYCLRMLDRVLMNNTVTLLSGLLASCN